MSGQLQYYQAQFEKFIEQPGVVNDALTYLQKKTQVKKAYIAYGTRIFMIYFNGSMVCKIVIMPDNFLRNSMRSSPWSLSVSSFSLCVCVEDRNMIAWRQAKVRVH